jgi:hypothetical protein
MPDEKSSTEKVEQAVNEAVRKGGVGTNPVSQEKPPPPPPPPAKEKDG